MKAIIRSLLMMFAIASLLVIPPSSPGAAAPADDWEDYTYTLTQSTTAYHFWTTTPSERVFKDAVAPTATGSGIKVYAARNEFEPFQIVVKPAASGNVAVNVGSFGSGITVELYQVKYVNLTETTDSLGRTGPYPDPLWPLANGASVALTADENTAFWFSVYVPAGVASGDYAANMTVGGVAIPVTLHVFDFAIPETLHVESQMNYSHETFLEAYSVPGTDTEYWTYVDSIKQVFIDHRLTPISPLWPGGLTGDAPLTVHFTDASTNGPTAWEWDFDNDGTVDSTEQHPTHTYTAPGVYTVRLRVTNDSSSDEEVKSDYISVSLPAVDDLHIVHAQADTSTLTATLRWTPLPQAVTTTLRYTSTFISDGTWTAATVISDSLPGNTDSFTANVQYAGGSVYFALKSQDADGAWLGLSNNAYWPSFEVYLPLVMRF